MMTCNNKLLSFIFQRHIGSGENAATDALGFILDWSAAAQQGLSNVLEGEVPGISPIAKVRTQVLIADGGRPDLECRDKHSNTVALIEAKFKANLTDHQPNTYWRTLPHDAPSALVCVAPDHQLRDLRLKFISRLAASGVQLGEENRASNLIRFPDRDSQRHLICISWDELLRRLEKAAIAKNDLQTSSVLARLRAGLSLSLKTDYNAEMKRPSKEGSCLCGCGDLGFPFRTHHNVWAKGKIDLALQSLKSDHRPNSGAKPVCLPKIMVDRAKTDAYFNFAGCTAADIIELAEKVGVC